MFGDDTLLTVHVILGVSILLLAILRLWWRRQSALAPWAPQLSAAGRRVEHTVEMVFYALLFVIPSSGLWLVFVDDDAVFVHVAAHLAFFVVLAVHVGIVVRYRLLRRML